jgi:hypothetical protein
MDEAPVIPRWLRRLLSGAHFFGGDAGGGGGGGDGGDGGGAGDGGAGGAGDGEGGAGAGAGADTGADTGGATAGADTGAAGDTAGAATAGDTAAGAAGVAAGADAATGGVGGLAGATGTAGDSPAGATGGLAGAAGAGIAGAAAGGVGGSIGGGVGGAAATAGGDDPADAATADAPVGLADSPAASPFGELADVPPNDVSPGIGEGDPGATMVDGNLVLAPVGGTGATQTLTPDQPGSLGGFGVGGGTLQTLPNSPLFGGGGTLGFPSFDPQPFDELSPNTMASPQTQTQANQGVADPGPIGSPLAPLDQTTGLTPGEAAGVVTDITDDVRASQPLASEPMIPTAVPTVTGTPSELGAPGAAAIGGIADPFVTTPTPSTTGPVFAPSFPGEGPPSLTLPAGTTSPGGAPAETAGPAATTEPDPSVDTTTPTTPPATFDERFAPTETMPPMTVEPPLTVAPSRNTPAATPTAPAAPSTFDTDTTEPPAPTAPAPADETPGFPNPIGSPGGPKSELTGGVFFGQNIPGLNAVDASPPAGTNNVDSGGGGAGGGDTTDANTIPPPLPLSAATNALSLSQGSPLAIGGEAGVTLSDGTMLPSGGTMTPDQISTMAAQEQALLQQWAQVVPPNSPQWQQVLNFVNTQVWGQQGQQLGAAS